MQYYMYFCFKLFLNNLFIDISKGYNLYVNPAGIYIVLEFIFLKIDYISSVLCEGASSNIKILSLF
jgi:hypothetical protein